MAEMKRSVKDSVFTYLFKQPEYTRQLYLALHPEDTDVKESDFKLVTLENVLTTGFYNDLGIQVRNRLILLVEAQSTFSVNIALRMLLYLAGTYKEYIEEQKLDLYGSHPSLRLSSGRNPTPGAICGLHGRPEGDPRDTSPVRPVPGCRERRGGGQGASG